MIGIVLAAGGSTRMAEIGQIKPVLDWFGKPMLEHVLQQAKASQLNAVWVVVGCCTQQTTLVVVARNKPHLSPKRQAQTKYYKTPIGLVGWQVPYSWQFVMLWKPIMTRWLLSLPIVRYSNQPILTRQLPVVRMHPTGLYGRIMPDCTGIR